MVIGKRATSRGGGGSANLARMVLQDERQGPMHALHPAGRRARTNITTSSEADGKTPCRQGESWRQPEVCWERRQRQIMLARRCAEGAAREQKGKDRQTGTLVRGDAMPLFPSTLLLSHGA